MLLKPSVLTSQCPLLVKTEGFKSILLFKIEGFNKPLQKCFLKEKTPHIPWLLVVKLFLLQRVIRKPFFFFSAKEGLLFKNFCYFSILKKSFLFYNENNLHFYLTKIIKSN